MKHCLTVGIALFTLACEPAFEEPYEVFVIPQGKHTGNFKVAMMNSETLRFNAIFDNSAIYTAATEENQWDIHKLMGFSDCNAHHHQNSARFGWRWLESKLEIMAYCYVDGERVMEKITEVNLNEENRYQLTMDDDHYIFTVNNRQPFLVKRSKPCDIGAYYMLWPYFGGQETAPHDITIKVKITY